MTAPDRVKQPSSSRLKSADCVVVLGPGTDKAKYELEHKTQKEGLTIAFVGDGKSDITEKMIEDARKQGVISPSSEVICILHGHIKKDKEGNKIHMVKTGDKKIIYLRLKKTKEN